MRQGGSKRAEGLDSPGAETDKGPGMDCGRGAVGIPTVPRRHAGPESMYQERTGSIEVTVEPFYIEEESAPEQGRYVFGYRIEIVNDGRETVQLLDRHWRITNGRGETTEVHGAGVVGKQPVLEPGERFEYASFCPLTTSSGIMVGSYDMVAADGGRFTVAIPAFSLDAPAAFARAH